MAIFQGQSTDLIVRCDDGKLIHVVASALAASSGFFSALLKDAVPTETVESLPVVDLAEGFDEAYRALRYADPTPMSIQDLKSGALDSAARVVLDKYLMLDGAISRISECLQYADAKGAFAVFGMLRYHRWPLSLVQVAADVVLRQTSPKRLDIVSPDHDHITARDFQAMQHMFRCPQARELWPIAGREICETCHRKAPLEIVHGPRNCTEAWAHHWFMAFLKEFAKSVRECPGLRLGGEEWAWNAIRMARASCDAQDKPATIRAILVAMDADLQRARDKVVSVLQ
ncbi:hypothetical protein BDZ89DRAFT_1111579 [Hymenopellis radicata]|nr:hypothetical protein BDZ89DRAFT_1111579 [Hymenopellis radicata]